MKICTKCSGEMPLSEFQRDKYQKDGYRPDCKGCRKQYYEDNKHKIKRKSKEDANEYNKSYYHKNRERILEEKKKNTGRTTKTKFIITH